MANTAANTADIDSHRHLPDTQTLQEADQLSIKDGNGKEVTFGSLHTTNARTMIIFIRHFFCGECELYIQSLCSQLPPSPSYSISIIGCGSPNLITDYRTRNNMPSAYALYADPSRTLYKKLGFRETSSPFSDGWKARGPEYHDRSFVSVAASSAWNMLSSGPLKAVKSGPHGQNGGTILFEDGKATFIHRMRDVGDYLNLKEAKLLLMGEA